MADDWDLQAVVRSCTSTSSSSAAANCHVRDQFLCFPDPVEPCFSPNFEDLSDLFKPFFPNLQPLSPLSVLGGLQELSPPLPPAPAPENRVKRNPKVSASPKSKRRRNQMKRVCQVPAEGLSSDIWSWRKYGQKPIKGSPYPRGYYKCSTSKGCLARKQVERSRSDPGMFILTYTGDHTHPIPTHRHSLARHVTSSSVTAGDPSKPNSPASSSLDDNNNNKMDGEDENDEGFSVSDVAISDDFFEGLEGLTGDCRFPVDFGLTFGCG